MYDYACFYEEVFKYHLLTLIFWVCYLTLFYVLCAGPLGVQILQDFVVFDVESSVKLRSDCDTGKGFILYIKSIV